jgi:hypothetical protein
MMKKMEKKQTVCMFCYRGEEEVILMSVDTLRRRMPYANIHIFDDAGDPLPDHIIENLRRSAGVHYHVTGFARGRNLNGKAAVCGVLDSLLAAAREDGNEEGYVIKTDPDTLFLRPDEYLAMMESGCAWMTHPVVDRFFSGMFYALSVKYLPQISANAHLMEMPEDAHEDSVVGSLANIAVHNSPDGFHWFNVWNERHRYRFCSFDPHRMDEREYVRYCARYAHILTVGNTGVAGLPQAYRVKMMRDVLDEFYKIEQSASGFMKEEELERKRE